MRLYGKYLSIHIRSMMQYKASFFLTAVGQFLTSFNVFLGVFFLFQRFHSVAGFTYQEVLLCFGIMLLEFSIAEAFARGFDTFPTMLANGEFDRILVRPRNEIFQVLASKVEFTRIGRVLQAVVMFFYGISASQVEWDFLKVLTVVFMLLGGLPGVHRDLPHLRRRVLLHLRGSGVYERPHRRGQGVWQVSGERLRQAGAAVYHLCGALRVDPVLPPCCTCWAAARTPCTSSCPSWPGCSCCPVGCCGGWGCATTSPPARKRERRQVFQDSPGLTAGAFSLIIEIWKLPGLARGIGEVDLWKKRKRNISSTSGR